MENQEFAKTFWEIAELLELKNDNIFKIRAYQKAARNIENLSDELESIYRKDGIKALMAIPGIGEHIAEKIEEQIKTGKVAAHDKLVKEFPKGVIEMFKIPGMGPKTALLFYQSLKIDTLEKLEKAAKAGRLEKLPGMGAKKVENILRGLELKKASHGRFLLDDATAQAELIVEELSQMKEVKKILPCGSLRRGQETVGDIDILVTSTNPRPIMERFTNLKMVKDVLAKGETKSSVILRNGMQADLRVVEPKSFGAAAHYFTGSKAHNIHIRQLAQQKGWKVSEYGIFPAEGGSASGGKGDKQIGGQTEEGMFSMFNLDFIPPELREMRGEFEAAAKHQLPKLVDLSDLKGDLHMHTTASDGENTIEEMAQAAKALDYEYILITDHTQSTRVAGGLNPKEMIKQLAAIRQADKNIGGIKILAGAEVDIRPNGSLDYPDELLRQLDLVVVAIHSSFKMDKEKMTKRIIRAFENKYANIFAHPTGRLIGEREPYQVDMEEVLKAAKRNNVAIEVNAHPKRLDLTDVHCKRAKELGVKVVISTDAHDISQLQLMNYGVITARRGWLEKKDILNTKPLKQLLKSLSSKVTF